MHPNLQRFSIAMLLIALLVCAAFPLAAMGEVVITIRDSDGSSVETGANDSVHPADSADIGEEADGGEISGTGNGANSSAISDGAASDNAASDNAAAASTGGDEGARAQFIDNIIALAQQKYDEANGRAQRAQYSGDIYVCKNFTVYLFRQNRDRFRMAEYPDVELVIPDNKPKKEMTDYVYGVEWKDVPASEGNPFYAAATFRYNTDKSKEENREDARAFLMQVQRGDYFQMAAKYYYGTGAHSMVFIADYDPETDSVRWCDSNMKGETKNGERYAYVQYDAVKEIDWFVDAFCRKKYGATLYRLRDDIVWAP